MGIISHMYALGRQRGKCKKMAWEHSVGIISHTDALFIKRLYALGRRAGRQAGSSTRLRFGSARATTAWGD